jgi:N12 class adenine-specific DNA methylase
MYDKNYIDEISTLSPGIGVWRQVAKGHPFMVLGCLNTMRHVSNEGYFLPTSIINNNYDRVAKTPHKVSMICDNIELLSNLTEQEIKNKVEELIPFMKRNKEKFFAKPNKRKFEKLFSEMAYE